MRSPKRGDDPMISNDPRHGSQLSESFSFVFVISILMKTTYVGMEFSK